MHARAAKPGTNVPLVVNVHGAAVRAWAKRLADRVNRKPAKVGLVLRHGRPYIGAARVRPHGSTSRSSCSASSTRSTTTPACRCGVTTHS